MNREEYILNLNKGDINMNAFYLFYTLGKGIVEEHVFVKAFPQFYQQQFPHVKDMINNRVIAVLDNHFKVNIVIKDKVVLKRY